jgi:hypothetical protein
MAVPDNEGDAMDKQNERLDSQADRLAEEALHELGDVPLDEPDDYARQCDFAGCYPWLLDVICAHPHDSAVLSVARTSMLVDEASDAQAW